MLNGQIFNFYNMRLVEACVNLKLDISGQNNMHFLIVRLPSNDILFLRHILIYRSFSTELQYYFLPLFSSRPRFFDSCILLFCPGYGGLGGGAPGRDGSPSQDTQCRNYNKA